MKSRNIASSPSPSIDSNDELISDDELEDDLDDINPEVDELADELEDDEDDDEDDEDDDEDDLDSPSVNDSETPEPPRKTQKRKKAIYEEAGSDDEEEEYEVVSNRPLTKRQRAKLEDNPTEEFLELPMESAKKKHLTAEEQTLKRSEVARRRKNQSIQRAEKDKEDTINRLLKKQATKSRKVIKDDAADEKESGSARRAALARDPNSLQYVSNAKGSFLSIPPSISIEQVFGPSYS